MKEILSDMIGKKLAEEEKASAKRMTVLSKQKRGSNAEINKTATSVLVQRVQ